MMPPLFKDAYCSTFDISPEAFREHLLRRSLHAPTRWLYPLLHRLSARCLIHDRTYLDCIGRVRTLAQLRDESHDFNRLRENRRFLRRFCLLRVSIARVHAIATEVLGPS